MSASQASHVTTNHDTIRTWIEERGGKPASVAGTEKRSESAGVLRVDFPGYGEDEAFEHLSWKDFFEKFEQADLAFLYQDRTDDGGVSRFNKFVSRESS